MDNHLSLDLLIYFAVLGALLFFFPPGVSPLWLALAFLITTFVLVTFRVLCRGDWRCHPSDY